MNGYIVAEKVRDQQEASGGFVIPEDEATEQVVKLASLYTRVIYYVPKQELLKMPRMEGCDNLFAFKEEKAIAKDR